MAGIRVRWGAVGKVAAVAVGGLVALQALPVLLRAPEPPPLAADVGLPRTAGAAEPHLQIDRPHGAVMREHVARAVVVERRADGDQVISAQPRRRPAKPRPVFQPEPKAISTPPPSLPSPATPTIPQPEPAPAAPPAASPPPGDGSIEFAPH